MIASSEVSWEDAEARGQFVFISHSREDKKLIAKTGILTELAKLRIHSVIDNAYSGLMPRDAELAKYVHQIPVGENWKAWIHKYAQRADCVLLLLSETFFTRLRNQRGKYEWCIAEMRAGANGQKLLPVKIENLAINFEFLNSLVESAIDSDQEVADFAGDLDARDGALAKLSESIIALFDVRQAARTDIQKRRANTISRAGQDILLDMMAREQHCQEVAKASAGVAVVYGDKASRADRMVVRLATVELPRSFSKEQLDPRQYRANRIRAIDAARHPSWHIKTFALCKDGRELDYVKRLRTFAVDELTRFIEDNTTLCLSEPGQDKHVDGLQYLVYFEIEVNERCVHEVLDLVKRMTANWPFKPRDDLRILISLLWSEAWASRDLKCVLPPRFLKHWPESITSRDETGDLIFRVTDPLAPLARFELNEWCHLIAACRESAFDDGRPAEHLDAIYSRPRPAQRFWHREIRCSLRSMEELRKEVRKPLERWINT